MHLHQWHEIRHKFMDYCRYERGLSEQTLRAYVNDLSQLTTFWEQLEQLHKGQLFIQVQKLYIQELYIRHVKPVTAGRKISTINSVNMYLNQQGYDYPIHKLPRRPKKLPTFLTEEQISALLDKTPVHKLKSDNPYRDRAIIELLYATGIRSFELCGILIEHVNKEQRTIKIIGKGKRERMVIYGVQAAKKIDQYFKKERIGCTSPYLFTNGCTSKKYDHLIPRTVQRIINRYAQYVPELPRLAPHMIRHTFATHLMNKGMDVRMIQSLLGHQDINTTQNYTHVSMERLSRSTNQLHPMNAKRAKG